MMMLDRGELSAVTLMINTPEGRAFEEQVLDLLRQGLAARDDPYEVFKAHMETAVHIRGYEHMHRQGEAGAKKAGRSAGAAGKAGDREEARSKQAEKAEWERYRFLGQTGARAMRSLNDALVWRALRYDRASVATLVSNRPTGALQPGPDLELEVRTVAELQDHFGDVAYAFWNDATNVLRLGDCTLIDRESGMVAGLYELTTGTKTKARKRRQNDALERGLTLLHGGDAPVKGRLRRHAAVSVIPETQIKAIVQVAEAAHEQGIAAYAPTSYFAVSAMHLPALLAVSEKKSMEWIRKAHRVTAHMREGEAVSEFTSYLAHVDHPVNAAPWAILPVAPEVRAKLISGSIELTTYLNFGEWFREVHEAGWEVWVPESWPRWKDYRERPRIWRAGMSMVLSHSLMGRMTCEGLSPQTVLAVAEEFHKAGPRADMDAHVSFTGEESLWD